jgi:hypothetical protein
MLTSQAVKRVRLVLTAGAIYFDVDADIESAAMEGVCS